MRVTGSRASTGPSPAKVLVDPSDQRLTESSRAVVLMQEKRPRLTECWHSGPTHKHVQSPESNSLTLSRTVWAWSEEV